MCVCLAMQWTCIPLGVFSHSHHVVGYCECMCMNEWERERLKPHLCLSFRSTKLLISLLRTISAQTCFFSVHSQTKYMVVMFLCNSELRIQIIIFYFTDHVIIGLSRIGVGWWTSLQSSTELIGEVFNYGHKLYKWPKEKLLLVITHSDHQIHQIYQNISSMYYISYIFLVLRFIICTMEVLVFASCMVNKLDNYGTERK